MRREQRIEAAARAAVDASPKARLSALAALRAVLDAPITDGRQPIIDHDAVIARLRNGEGQSTIAHDLGCSRNAIHRIAKSIGLSVRARK